MSRATAVPTARPRFRGVSHQIAFLVSLAAGPVLVVAASGTTLRIEVAIYACSLSGLLGVSVQILTRNWPPRARRNLRRLDHSMIFVLIAGTYTPIAGTALTGGLRTIVLATVWIGALAGVVFTVAWIDAPKWAAAIPYVALGWVAVGTGRQLVDGIGGTAVALLALGGVLYTAGALVYATRRPDPVPTVFGYHEVFHVLVIIAAVVHYTVIATSVLP